MHKKKGRDSLKIYLVLLADREEIDYNSRRFV